MNQVGGPGGVSRATSTCGDHTGTFAITRPQASVISVSPVLAQRASDLDWARFEGIKSLGITAGASAPEVIVEEIMGAFAERYELHVETVSAAEENEFFPLPRSLRPDAA